MYQRSRPSFIAAFFTLFILSLVWPPTSAFPNYELPPLPPPEEYGNITLDNVSSAAGQPSVVFPHWLHRLHFTCEVCHTELEIEMEVGATGIDEAAIKQKRYCGACHDGDTAFGRKGNCQFCHGGFPGRNDEFFAGVFNASSYPTTAFGNGINWSEAIARGIISPIRSLQPNYRPIQRDKTLTLEAELGRIAPAVFPHDIHLQWMDCNMCHPYPFNLRKKGTQNFRMQAILKGDFCGACHLNVAFPINDCQRCHPKMERG